MSHNFVTMSVYILIDVYTNKFSKSCVLKILELSIEFSEHLFSTCYVLDIKWLHTYIYIILIEAF